MTPHEKLASQLEAVGEAARAVVELRRASGQQSSLAHALAVSHRRVTGDPYGQPTPWPVDDLLDAMLTDLKREHEALVEHAAVRGEP